MRIITMIFILALVSCSDDDKPSAVHQHKSLNTYAAEQYLAALISIQDVHEESHDDALKGDFNKHRNLYTDTYEQNLDQFLASTEEYVRACAELCSQLDIDLLLTYEDKWLIYLKEDIQTHFFGIESLAYMYVLDIQLAHYTDNAFWDLKTYLETTLSID